MNSSIDNPMIFYNNIIINLYRYIGIPLYIFGNLGNLFIALIFFQKSWRKNVCVFYFLICLFLDTININSSMIGSIIISGFDINLNNSNLILCKLYNFLTLYLSTLSPTILVCASIDRLLISSQNVDTRLYSSKRLAYFSISISSFIWLLFFLHVLIKFDIQKLNLYVSICLPDLFSIYYNFLFYSMLTLNIIFFLLMIILSILSFKNVRRLRSIPRQQRHQTIRIMHKKDFQLLRCLYIKDIIYILTDLPFIIYTLYQTINDDQQNESLDYLLYELSIFIHHMFFPISFFIYITVSKIFRQYFKRILWKFIGKDLTLLRDDDLHETRKDNNNVQLNINNTITRVG